MVFFRNNSQSDGWNIYTRSPMSEKELYGIIPLGLVALNHVSDERGYSSQLYFSPLSQMIIDAMIQSHYANRNRLSLIKVCPRFWAANRL